MLASLFDSSRSRFLVAGCASCSAFPLFFGVTRRRCRHALSILRSFWVCFYEVHPFSFLKDWSFRVSAHNLEFFCFILPTWPVDDGWGFASAFSCTDFRDYLRKWITLIEFRLWLVCLVFQVFYQCWKLIGTTRCLLKGFCFPSLTQHFFGGC